MRHMPSVLAALIAACLLAPAAQAAEVQADSERVLITDSAPETNVISVTVSGPDVHVSASSGALTAGSGCSAGTPIVCAGAAGLFLDALLDAGDDVLTWDGVKGRNVYGGTGDDTLTGGALDDFAYGQEGADELNGGGGVDRLEGDDQSDATGGNDELDGGAGDDLLIGWRGADLMRDTGGGNDTVTYFFAGDPNGVEVTLDGAANDGNVNEDAGGTDNVGAGIEHVQGTEFADELQGGDGNDSLNGFGGNDLLVGNGGEDEFIGASGDDRIEARDGRPDDVDCDNSMGTQGAADVAVVDASETGIRNCETVNAPAPARNDGGTTTTTPPPPATTTATPPAGGTSPFAVTTIASESTVQRSRMPAVVGRKLDPARAAVLRVTAGVDLDVVFQRSCRESQDLEVTRQRPAAGTALQTFEGSDVPVRLYVCLAERDFLRDCDLSGIRSDLKELPRRQDAEPGLVILRRVSKCKVDYDIRLAKAAEEAQLAMTAQRDADAKRKRAAEIKAGLSCPVAPAEQHLRIGLTEGYNPERSSAVLFGLHSSGGPNGWKLPSNPQGQFRSFVDLQLFERGFRLNVEATIFIDAEGVGIEQQQGTARGSATPQRVTTRGGYARINFSPRRAGTIRLCAVIETGDDEVVSAGVAIDVVGPLKVGDRWETIGGRTLELRPGGPAEIEPPAVARAANLGQVWDWLVGLFSGRSRTVNAAQREGTVKLAKVRKVSSSWAAAQVTLDGSLESDPQPPRLEQGTCITGDGKGLVSRLTCPVLNTTNNAALLGMSTTGARIVAAGAGNVIAPGSRLIGADGATLIGADGATLIGADGATLIGADGATALGAAPAQLIGADGATLIGADGATLIGADGAT